MSEALLEREHVLATVQGCIDLVCSGQGGAVFAVGEAGLGKTAVLDWARRHAPAEIDVAFGRGEPMEELLAFGLASQALGDVGGELFELDSSAVEPSVPYYRALRWMEARGERPLLIALDDLHWSDGDSLSLFAFLARRLARFPVALIGTLRPWPRRALETCRELSHAGHGRIVQLEPLGRTATESLLTARLGTPVSEPAVDKAFGLSGGNPLLTRQVAAVMARGGHIGDEGTARFGSELLLTRFAGLDPDGLEVARAASVFGASFRPELVIQALGIDRARGEQTVDALCGSGIAFEERTGALRFAHPLFAQALYEDLPAPKRLRLHARAFALLVERGLEAQAAEHAMRADLTGDPRAVEVLMRVGRAALEAGAVEAATRNLEAAVALAGDRADAPVLLALAHCLSASGRMQDVAAVCRRMLTLEQLDWRERIEVLRMLGRSMYLIGSADHGGEALERAVAIALEHDPVAAVEALLDQSLSAWAAAGPGAALPLAARALELSAGAGAELRERAAATWGHMALESGDPAGLAATESLGRRLSADLPDTGLEPSELIWPWASIYQYAMNANYVERYDEAERTFVHCRGIVEATGAANALATLAIYIGHAQLRLGRPQEAHDEAVRAAEFAELTPGVLAYAEVLQAEALVWMGRFEESERHSALAAEHGAGQWFARVWLAHVRGLRWLWEGDARASDELLVAEDVTLQAGIGEPCHVMWPNHAITAHLAVGRELAASRVLDWVEACAARLPCAWPRIAAAVGSAELAEHVGDADEAERHFGRALELHAGVEMPMQRIEALLAYGRFLRRRGRPSDARPPLATALQQAERVGAGWLARAAAEELALAGGRRRRGVGERDQLTEAERRVAKLAGEGHANAEIARRLHLSVNTVQTHLRHVYAKLGISSRHQLRDFV